jgi:hypothetical protein
MKKLLVGVVAVLGLMVGCKAKVNVEAPRIQTQASTSTAKGYMPPLKSEPVKQK